MIEHHLDITTRDGQVNTFICHPQGDQEYPVVVFLMDAPGKREELHDMVRRIAATGYYVMLPNLYYRKSRDFASDGTPESREVMFGYMNSLSNKMVVQDCEDLLSFAADKAHANQNIVGTIGYCMSGPFAIAAAAQLSQVVKAAASFHGVRLCVDTEDSPHLDADKIPGEIYIGCAETDDWAPQSMIDELDEHLTKAGTNFRIEWYPETVHGFVFPNRGPAYHQAAAERHWEVIHDLLDRNLK